MVTKVPPVCVTLLDVRVAVLSEIGEKKAKTGIFKKTMAGPVRLSVAGLVGDTQADRRLHGGKEKAVYHYPREHYGKLKDAFPHLAETFSKPCVGENFSTLGLLDTDVYIGDVFAIGTAIVQVSQPRMPCWKLNHALGNAYMGRFIISQATTGWYYRVLQEGELEIGQTMTLMERSQSSISVQGVWRTWVAHNKDPINNKLPDVPDLSDEWKGMW